MTTTISEAQAWALRDLVTPQPDHLAERKRYPGAMVGYGWPASTTCDRLMANGWLARALVLSSDERAENAAKRAEEVENARVLLNAGEWQQALGLLQHVERLLQVHDRRTLRITRAGCEKAIAVIEAQRALVTQSGRRRQPWQRYGRPFSEGCDDVAATIDRLPVAEDFGA